MASRKIEPTSPVEFRKQFQIIQLRLLMPRLGRVIHDALLHALHASPTNWPTMIQNHALSLLRSGECTTFHEVLERVLEDIHVDTVVARSSTSQTPDLSSNGHSGGEKRNESNGTKILRRMEGSSSSSNSETRKSLVIPPNVVEEGMRITRECLETMCEIDE
ncbi:hypothetical protein EPUL_002792 [Erysiphe pulchra]|uniref:Uncharacterized protein n=1 Tax=Erysiphe pulchra TaxID=225359 RepID=A0A2S4PVC6_9PEZI|nr:hypothetical protein EPUL_002792 [Erysiphe pulchra]